MTVACRQMFNFSSVYVFVFTFVCLSVCFSTRYLKYDAARITKPDIDMVHYDYWKPIYFEVKRSKVKVTRHKKSLSALVMALI